MLHKGRTAARHKAPAGPGPLPAVSLPQVPRVLLADRKTSALALEIGINPQQRVVLV